MRVPARIDDVARNAAFMTRLAFWLWLKTEGTSLNMTIPVAIKASIRIIVMPTVRASSKTRILSIYMLKTGKIDFAANPVVIPAHVGIRDSYDILHPAWAPAFVGVPTKIKKQ
jgi:hypothetical protein